MDFCNEESRKQLIGDAFNHHSLVFPNVYKSFSVATPIAESVFVHLMFSGRASNRKRKGHGWTMSFADKNPFANGR
jgi:hypothetical protein